MDEHHAHLESEPVGTRSQRVVQAILLVVGVVSLFWLINIFALSGNILPDTTEILPPTTWGIIAVVMLGLVFVGEMVLLFFRPS